MISIDPLFSTGYAPLFCIRISIALLFFAWPSVFSFNVLRKLLPLPVRDQTAVLVFSWNKGNDHRDLRHWSSSFTFHLTDGVIILLFTSLTRLDEYQFESYTFKLYINGKMCGRISVVVCLPPKKRIVLPLWYHLRVLRSSCSTMLISMPIGHWVRSYSASCRYQSDTVFYHSAHHLRFMAFVFVYEPYFPAASIRVHRQSSFRIFHKGDRFPKAAVRTLVRNRSRFSGGSSV